MMIKQTANPEKLTDLNSKEISQREQNSVKHGVANTKSQDSQNIKTLTAFEKELERNRSKYLKAWVESITKLQDELGKLKSEVRNDFRMELRDEQYYRINMFQMEAKISEMKENIKNELCSLFKEESDLNKELQLTERRVEEWGKLVQSNIMKPVISSVYRIQSQEVKNDPLGEFQKFLTSSGGHYGGWEEQDHLLFLRERRKYNGKPKFLTVVHSLIPEITEVEIEAHEDWYKKYEQLKNLQKEAIRKWRASKTTVIEHSNAFDEQKEAVNENKKGKNITYQRDIAERIKEWKRQQQLKKAEQEERERKEQQSMAEERMKKRELQKAKKIAIEQYKAEKISRIQSELIASQKIKELQSIEDKARKNILLKAFREQDQHYIERIKNLRAQSASKVRERTERLENAKPVIEILVERDRRRVIQPTQVWNHHCLQQENHMDRPGKIMDLQTIPHLAIPSWRKGLSNY